MGVSKCVPDPYLNRILRRQFRLSDVAMYYSLNWNNRSQKFLLTLAISAGVPGLRTGENTHIPQRWRGFDSQT